MNTTVVSNSLTRVPPAGRVDWVAIAAVTLFTVLFMAVAWSTLGATLGLLFAGIAAITTLVPNAAARSTGWRPTVSLAFIACGVVAGAWLPMIPDGAMTLGQWAGCASIAAGYALALSGVAWMLSRWVDPSASTALVTILALAWLSWPVWLSAALTGSGGENVAGRLVVAHPLFATNGLTFERLGVWTERPLMYDHLTALGQDVAYELPKNPWPCVVLHAVIGLAAFGTRELVQGRPRATETRRASDPTQ